MTKGQSMVLEAGKEHYHKLKDSNIVRDVFNHFKPIIDDSFNIIISKDMKEPYLSFDVEDKQVRCSVHGGRFDGEVISSWYYQPFIYIENEYKNPTYSQRNGLRLVLAEKFEEYLKSHPLVLEVSGWDLLYYDETKIEIAFKLTPNRKLRDW